MHSENISLEASRKVLSASAGLYFFGHLWSRFLELDGKLREILPQSLITTRTDAVSKTKALALGLIEGAECLDDMEKCAKDPLFREINGGKLNAPNTYGLFLASFRHQHCRSLNQLLKKSAFRLRKALFPQQKLFILDIDSTDSKQSGEKMEGLAFNHKNNWGLDSIVAFEQLGFEYWHDVRPGNTFTANGATEILSEVVKHARHTVFRIHHDKLK